MSQLHQQHFEWLNGGHVTASLLKKHPAPTFPEQHTLRLPLFVILFAPYMLLQISLMWDN